MMILYRSQFFSSIGEILLVTDEKERVFALDFSDRRPSMTQGLREFHLKRKFNDCELTDRPAPESIARALIQYFDGNLAALNSVLVAEVGVGLQREVWTALRKVSPGKMISCGNLSRSLGYFDAGSAVKVEAAVWENPVAIVVPSHRVISENGDLNRYAWGITKKRWLLEHEHALPNISTCDSIAASERTIL
jgi:methylated-DNA-[protein]-cysteine S-methyltransferase